MVKNEKLPLAMWMAQHDSFKLRIVAEYLFIDIF